MAGINVNNIGSNGINKRGASTDPPEKTLSLSKELANKKTEIKTNTPEPGVFRYNGSVYTDKIEYVGKIRVVDGEGEVKLMDEGDFTKMQVVGVLGIAKEAAFSLTGGTAKSMNIIMGSRFALSAGKSYAEGNGVLASLGYGALGTVLKPTFAHYHHGISHTAEHALQRTAQVAGQKFGTNAQKVVEAYIHLGHGIHKVQTDVQKALKLQYAIKNIPGNLKFSPYTLDIIGKSEYASAKFMYKTLPKEVYYGATDPFTGGGAFQRKLGDSPEQLYEAMGNPNLSQNAQAQYGGEVTQKDNAATKINLITPERGSDMIALDRKQMILNATAEKPKWYQYYHYFKDNVLPKNEWVLQFEQIVVPEKYDAYIKIKKIVEESQHKDSKNWIGAAGSAISGLLFDDLVKSIGKVYKGGHYKGLLAAGKDENKIRLEKLAKFKTKFENAGGKMQIDPKTGNITLIVPTAEQDEKRKKELQEQKIQTEVKLATSMKQSSTYVAKPVTLKLFPADTKTEQNLDELRKGQFNAAITNANQQSKIREAQIRQWAITNWGKNVNGVFMYTNEALAKLGGAKSWNEVVARYDKAFNISYQGPTISQARPNYR